MSNTKHVPRPLGTRNRMVKICQGMTYIQEHSQVKGNRRYGRRIIVNPQFAEFLAEREKELYDRRLAESFYHFEAGKAYRVEMELGGKWTDVSHYISKL